MISKPLQTAVNETLENGKQVILLINRRGFSTYTQCQACGHVIECPNCGKYAEAKTGFFARKKIVEKDKNTTEAGA